MQFVFPLNNSVSAPQFEIAKKKKTSKRFDASSVKLINKEEEEEDVIR